MHGIYFIVTVIDPDLSISILEQVIHTGIQAVQLRAKQGIDLQSARYIHTLCKRAQIPLIVNDDLELALHLKAEGLHLGQTDLPIRQARRYLPHQLIGSTAPLPYQIQKAASEGANYIGVGHVFPTTTKLKKGPPIGYAGLKQAVLTSPLPVVAIGGLTAQSLPSIYQTGASSAAICAAIANAPDPKQAAQHLVDTWNAIYPKFN
ncbi:MAG: Thiamine-phosphate synthase [Chlamydiales bacterium]|nr:Thiamine-phosphate synthase [Chlamydiales bacterium]